MIESHSCQVCGSRLHKIDAYSHLPRVTFDCKPWPSGGTFALCVDCGAIQKIPDAAWLDEIRRIYGNYQIYLLSGGAEQVIFLDQGQILPRSVALISFFCAKQTYRILEDCSTLGVATALLWPIFQKDCQNGPFSAPNFQTES